MAYCCSEGAGNPERDVSSAVNSEPTLSPGRVLHPLPEPGRQLWVPFAGDFGASRVPENTCQAAEGTLAGRGAVSVLPGLLSVRSLRPQGAPRPPLGLSARPLSSSAAARLPGRGWRRACLMVWMGDGFQGEISSSVSHFCWRQRTKCHPARSAPSCSPVAFKFTPFPSLTPV